MSGAFCFWCYKQFHYLTVIMGVLDPSVHLIVILTVTSKQQDPAFKHPAVLWTLVVRVHLNELFISRPALSSKQPKRCAARTICFCCGPSCWSCRAWLLPQLCKALVVGGGASMSPHWWHTRRCALFSGRIRYYHDYRTTTTNSTTTTTTTTKITVAATVLSYYGYPDNQEDTAITFTTTTTTTTTTTATTSTTTSTTTTTSSFLRRGDYCSYYNYYY